MRLVFESWSTTAVPSAQDTNLTIENGNDVSFIGASFGFPTFALAIFANAFNILLMIRCRHFNSSIHRDYMMSLSAAHFANALFVVLPATLHSVGVPIFDTRFVCDAWQVSDGVLPSVSLLSACAGARYRTCNMVQPLGKFKSDGSRLIARFIILGAWVVPIAVFVVCLIFTTVKDDNYHCAPRFLDGVVPTLIFIFYYLPAGCFVVGSLVGYGAIRKHFGFLRQHSNLGCSGGGGAGGAGTGVVTQPTASGQALNSPSAPNSTNGKSKEGTPKPEKKISDSSLTVTSGYSTLRSPRSPSPRYQRAEFQLAPLSEERSSGRERSFSEQIPSARISQFEENSNNHLRITGVTSMPTRKQSLWEKRIVVEQRGEGVFSSLLSPRRSRSMSTDTGIAKPGSFLFSRSISRRLSSLSRFSSNRDSIATTVIDISLLRRCSVKAKEKSVMETMNRIHTVFFLTWVPFLVVWPMQQFNLTPYWLYILTVWLNYSASALDPLVYFALTPRVRKVVRGYFSQRTHQGTSNQKVPQSFYRSITMA